MKRGWGDPQWIPAHEVSSRKADGWTVVGAWEAGMFSPGAPDNSVWPYGDQNLAEGRLDPALVGLSFSEDETDGPRSGMLTGQTVVGLEEMTRFAHRFFGPSLGGDFSQDLEGTIAAWYRNETGDEGIVRGVRQVGTSNGHMVFEAEIQESGFGGFSGTQSSRIPGLRAPRQTYRIRFETPIGEESTTVSQAQQSLQEWVNAERDRDPWMLANQDNQISENTAADLTNRLFNLTSFVDENVWNNAVQEVQKVLNNERLGDPARREILADMVMGEIEASANSFAWAQGADWEAIYEQLNVPTSAPTGGGGRGFSRPVYQPPDRREVEENVRNYLSLVLADTSNKSLINELTDLYMSEHKRSFDNPGIGLRPWFSVKERVQALEEYDKLHALRPDTINEEDWVSQFQGLIDQAGIPANLRDQTARNFAQIGATIPAATGGVYRQREMQTGRPQPVFLRNLQNTLQTLARRF